MQHTLYLGLGSNLGDKQQNIAMAVEKIEELIGHVECQSALHITEPWGFQSDNMFVNAAVKCVTILSPHEVLEKTKDIERQMGRTTKSVDGTYKDRIIDIDILLYDDMEINDPDLVIPHPLMHQRDFVMKPLNEIIDK
ncbi:2-amino-4-hydroxy-6-hydroxymethyldihydropteridine diphosphokinase [Prevotella sp. P2-180]|uniref:2-amino-4-hydroxy-6- hydroxymethyldihydropteridine diphosphokinase n=1 Tax=Prevotella sp. P2-180 TaxID=2024224 RepID=UPI00209C2034|nr:2-amino-4-hydroxy-6-hydroxymethyldihydropteridine diphosphokinase [Prevotella sp. P2-180]MCI6338803.1 2-amino-4-hydroxy-6-hydroxymethyldihydropteridine diphosphokinase [Prevotella sp.]MDD5783414.1 2-amino-4-hydroxy-6-hydroxymethyldihydropteridine diphosphokinase [Prevotella sp.]MDD6863307.1 2-amino-4-hydroxy-6-hydroxymethyldihydropteridine diphosphokinase [Prevotella sp.]MDD7225591.1 2-amino-4-hydroxy-6-hydroxymethyldihydropteridine diphosphokinase [Prevotella sp.]MDY4498585.1 2-amino-4-hyd